MTMLRILLLYILSYPLHSLGQDGSDIISAHLKAIGGEAAWRKVNSLQFEGRIDNDFETMRIKQYWIKDKSYRRDMQYGGRTVADTGMRYFVLIHQNKGWKLLPDQIKTEPVALDKSEILHYLQDLELDDPFIGFKEAGKKINYVGTEFFNETDYHKFLISTPNGTQEYCYLDMKNLMIHMRVVIGSDNDQTRVFENWTRNTEGLMLPGTISSPQGVLTLEQIRLNPKLNPDIFSLTAIKP